MFNNHNSFLHFQEYDSDTANRTKGLEIQWSALSVKHWRIVALYKTLLLDIK